MKHKIAATIFILSIVAFGQPPVLAQVAGQPKFGTWEAVKGIPSGEKVEITLKSGKTIKGEISGVSDTEITVGRDSKAVTTGRDEVRRVFHAVGKSSRKPVVAGALIGAAVGTGGLAIAVAARGSTETSELVTAMAFIGLAGAGIGALIGNAFRRGKKLVLIYESL